MSTSVEKSRIKAPGRAAHLILVVGVRGGLGASSLAAHLAAAHGAVLVDLDPAGPGVEVLLGIESAPGLRWSDVHGARGSIDGESVAEALPRWSGIAVLSGDRLTGFDSDLESTMAVISALHDVGHVVLDLPRQLFDSPLGVLLRAQAGELVIVVGQDLVSVAGGWGMLQRAATPPAEPDAGAPTLRLVVRRQAGAALSATEVSAGLGLDLVAVLAEHRGLRAQVEFGRGPSPGPLRRRHRAVRAALAGRPGGPAVVAAALASLQERRGRTPR